MQFKQAIAAAAVMLGGATGAMAQQDTAKVGFVYVGPIGDFGWTYEHNIGREAVEAAFGDAVETTFVESVPEGPDAERVIRQMAQSGHDLIFTTSFGYMNPTNKVAAQFPDVKFEHATGYKRGTDNVSTYSARFYEGRTIIGHIAGHMTESNQVGYIASFPIPEVVRGINSAYLAAKAVNPDVEFKIVWVNTWFDPGKEADAASALIEQGVDVIMQHTDSPAAMTIAQETWEDSVEGNEVYAFGQASDMAQFGPDARLSSIIDDWAPYYVARTQAVLDGTWEQVDVWDGIKPGMVEIGSFSDKIPAEVQASAMAIKEGIMAGAIHSFTGPVKKQDGSDWLGAGETADDGTLLGMDFYVEGITGELPK